MGTTTSRNKHIVKSYYTDLTVSIPEAAGAGGFIAHLGSGEVEIVLGGDTAPAADVRGALLIRGDSMWAEADHIWVRCLGRGKATLGFSVVE